MHIYAVQMWCEDDVWRTTHLSTDYYESKQQYNSQLFSGYNMRFLNLSVTDFDFITDQARDIEVLSRTV